MSTPLKIVGTDFTAMMEFIIVFSQTPNFTTLDSNGRPQDSFQIYIAFNPATPNPQSTTSVEFVTLDRPSRIHTRVVGVRFAVACRSKSQLCRMAIRC